MAGLHHSRSMQSRMLRRGDGFGPRKSTINCTQRTELPSHQLQLLHAINNDRLASGLPRLTIEKFRDFTRNMF